METARSVNAGGNAMIFYQRYWVRLCVHRKVFWKSVQWSIRAWIPVVVCVLGLTRGADSGESRPPLQGGVERSEPYRPNPTNRSAPREGYCERYAASVAQLSGRIQIMPKAGGGGPIPQGRPIPEYCLAPNSKWTLLGEDRNHCCFFAPSEWEVKIPPLPGNVQETKRPPDRRPTKDDPKRDPTYDRKPRDDGPLPWEQPAQAQTPQRISWVNVTVTWDSPPHENRDRRHRKGECSFSIDFYRDGRAIVKDYRYLNEDIYRSRTFPDRLELERIRGGPATFDFVSNLSVSPKGNYFYDITWTNPTLDTTQENFSRIDYRGAEWQPQPSRGAPAYTAHCIGRSAGQAGNSPVMLMSVRRIGSLRPTSSTNTSTIIVANLEKQVSKAGVTMNWNFQQ
jgi:hypothetical protein